MVSFIYAYAGRNDPDEGLGDRRDGAAGGKRQYDRRVRPAQTPRVTVTPPGGVRADRGTS